MKIGVISDTHDYLKSINKSLNIFRNHKVEMIIHCGDWVSPFTLEYFDFVCQDFRVPVKSVFGNNEGDIKSIIERNSQLKNPIQFAPKQVLAVFTGHTHKVRNEKTGDVLVLNPGTTSFASGSKIVNKATVAIFNSASNSAEILSFN